MDALPPSYHISTTNLLRGLTCRLAKLSTRELNDVDNPEVLRAETKTQFEAEREQARLVSSDRGGMWL